VKYKNLDVYWDGLTGSVLLFGEEDDALDFVREFNSGKFDPSCCPAFSEDEALEIYEEEGIDGLMDLFEFFDNIFFFTNGKQIVFDYNKMKSAGIEPFDRDEFLKNFVVQCEKEESLRLFKKAVKKNDKNILFVKDEDDEYPTFYLWFKRMKNTDIIETLDLLVDLKYWSNNHRAMECCFEYCGEDEVFDLLKKVDEVYYDDRFS
jgi:hypothetical protein